MKGRITCLAALGVVFALNSDAVSAAPRSSANRVCDFNAAMFLFPGKPPEQRKLHRGMVAIYQVKIANYCRDAVSLDVIPDPPVSSVVVRWNSNGTSTPVNVVHQRIGGGNNAVVNFHLVVPSDIGSTFSMTMNIAGRSPNVAGQGIRLIRSKPVY